jgi:hypothetical protein
VTYRPLPAWARSARAERAYAALIAAPWGVTLPELARVLDVAVEAAQRTAASLVRFGCARVDGALVHPLDVPAPSWPRRRCRVCKAPVPPPGPGKRPRMRENHCSAVCWRAEKNDRDCDEARHRTASRVRAEQAGVLCRVCGGPIRPGARVRTTCGQRGRCVLSVARP